MAHGNADALSRKFLHDQVLPEECNQCCWRGFIHQGMRNAINACQVTYGQSSSAIYDPSTSPFYCQDDTTVKTPGIPFTRNVSAVNTRAQVRRGREMASMQSTGAAPAENATSRRTLRRKRKQVGIQRSLEPWTSKLLTMKQAEDADLNCVQA